MRLIDADKQESIIEELENICINNEYALELLAKLKNQPTVDTIGFTSQMNDLISREHLLSQYDLQNCTKYGNRSKEQQIHSYDTMMMYEIADMIKDAPAVLDMVGDTVYKIEDACSHPKDCGLICRDCPDNRMEIYTESFTPDMLGELGDTVFLTKEDAAQKLKELNKENSH